MQFASKDPAGLLNLLICGLARCRESKESMDHRRRDSNLGADTGLLQPARELAAFVEQGVMCREMNERGRYPREIRGVDGACRPVLPGGKIRAVVIPVPGHRSSFKQEFLGELEHARSIEVCIGDGIDKELKGDPSRAGITILDRGHCSEIAAGTVPADRQPRWITFEFAGMIRGPDHRGDGILVCASSIAAG